MSKVKNLPIPYMTFDSKMEVLKIKEESPKTKPILRIFVDDKGGARIPLNSKFGFHLENIEELNILNPNFHIYGLAFHVGSDCTSLVAYKSAFDTVRKYLEMFQYNEYVFTPELLDIGGGFSGSTKNNEFFRKELAPYIRHEVKSLPFQKVIAEPGRFFAEESSTLQVEVIGRKRLPNGKQCITVNESVYGMFSGVLFDGFVPSFNCITRNGVTNYEKFTIFGRTCDSADKIAEDVWLPASIGESDILEIPNIGAYSWVSASKFNGFPLPYVEVR